TGAIHLVIIHTCESNYTSCWSWLENPVSQASAHYVVNEDGSAISQLVLERNRAWHIAALYDCTLNRRHHCWLNGVQSNHFAVRRAGGGRFGGVQRPGRRDGGGAGGVAGLGYYARLLRRRISLGAHSTGRGGQCGVLVPGGDSGPPHGRRPLDERVEAVTAGRLRSGRG